MNRAVLLVLFIASAMAYSPLGLGQPVYDHINSLQSTWTAGYNPRWDHFDLETIHTQFGTFLDTPPELQLPEKDIQESQAIPDSFDAREQWPGCESIREVRDQSACGSCWALGAVEAMSDRLCIASGQVNQTRISAEDLLSCCDYCGFGCNGGYSNQAWNYFWKSGIVTGNEYGNNHWCRAYSLPPCEHHGDGKYPACGSTKPTPGCIYKCHVDSGRNYTKDIIYAKTAYSISSVITKIQTEIMTLGPVEAAFTVYEDFLTYKSGVYKHTTGNKLGGHAIKIIGWGVENGTPYWLCTNSWNEDWGDNGFFKILRGSNHCGIEAGINAGVV